MLLEDAQDYLYDPAIRLALTPAYPLKYTQRLHPYILGIYRLTVSEIAGKADQAQALLFLRLLAFLHTCKQICCDRLILSR